MVVALEPADRKPEAGPSWRAALCGVFGVIFCALVPTTSWADLRMVVIDEDQLPYELGPSRYENSPTNYDNSPTNYDNSATNYDNSPTNYDNSASNYDNGESSGRTLRGDRGERLGYYVLSEEGVINFYTGSPARRVAFLPSDGHTQSAFSEGGWCGVLGNIDGETVLALSQTCFYRFLLDG